MHFASALDACRHPVTAGSDPAHESSGQSGTQGGRQPSRHRGSTIHGRCSTSSEVAPARGSPNAGRTWSRPEIFCRRTACRTWPGRPVGAGLRRRRSISRSAPARARQPGHARPARAHMSRPHIWSARFALFRACSIATAPGWRPASSCRSGAQPRRGRRSFQQTSGPHPVPDSACPGEIRLISEIADW